VKQLGLGKCTQRRGEGCRKKSISPRSRGDRETAGERLKFRKGGGRDVGEKRGGGQSSGKAKVHAMKLGQVGGVSQSDVLSTKESDLGNGRKTRGRKGRRPIFCPPLIENVEEATERRGGQTMTNGPA